MQLYLSEFFRWISGGMLSQPAVASAALALPRTGLSTYLAGVSGGYLETMRMFQMAAADLGDPIQLQGSGQNVEPADPTATESVRKQRPRGSRKVWSREDGFSMAGPKKR